MINTQELKGRFVAKGYTQTEIAKTLNISQKTLREKLNKGVLNSDEIFILIDILDIEDPMAIFFAPKVT